MTDAEVLKKILDNARVCVDGQIRIRHVPRPAADATRPVAKARLLRAIDEFHAQNSVEKP